MSRKVIKTQAASREQLAPGMFINRPFPTRELRHFDPFLLLDQMGPANHAPGGNFGTGPHPHRGFITLSYILNGEIEHKDSQGHHGFAKAGGMQYMIAGSGIIHDEQQSKEFSEKGGRLHGFQLWINLPAKDKEHAPEYYNLNDPEIPRHTFNNGTYIKVLAGAYANAQSTVKTFSPLFVYHIHLPANTAQTIQVPDNFNVFAYVPEHTIELGEDNTSALGPTMAIFDNNSTELTLNNPANTAADIMLYGGAPIGEPIVPYGPFVMNTFKEIQMAIHDYEAGKYGTIDI
jgi:quercetin 2,3-dioxygenase